MGQDLHADLISHDTKTVAVNLLLSSKVLLEKFRVIISESKMFQENDCWMILLLNAADKTSKPFKNPKIQSLLDEIIYSSPEKSPSTKSQASPQNAPVIQ